MHSRILHQGGWRRRGSLQDEVCASIRPGSDATDFFAAAVKLREALFDLATDARERANLALREPDRLQTLWADWEQWATRMPPIDPASIVGLGFSESVLPRATH